MLITLESCIKSSGINPKGVLHIGAHHGEEGQDYANHGVKYVVWLDANRNVLRHLYDNTKFLPMKQEYLTAVLSDADNQKVDFLVTNNGQSSSILPLGTHKNHYPHIHVVESREVVTSRFDTFYRENLAKIELDNIQMINIDVQGAELKVLKGFGNLLETYQNIKMIYTEINREEVYVGAALVEEIDSYLSQFGFSRILTKDVHQGWGDALYVRP